jgi:hypothetical protein
MRTTPGHLVQHQATAMAGPGRGGRGWSSQRGFRGGGFVRGGINGGRGGRHHQTTGGRGTATPNDQRPCHNFQQSGNCRFGTSCIYSHDLTSNTSNNASPSRPRERPEDTPEQQEAKANYYSWKRLIKSAPRANDIETIRLLWIGALDILDGDDREGRQMLPRDLDNAEYFGRQHMQTLLTMETHVGGHGTFIDLARPFILVMSHPALLNCLTVDTSVGNLYNFMSGSNGSRAIHFFQNFSTNLVEQHLEYITLNSTTTLEGLLEATTISLRELLRREMRATFHDALPDLLNSLENAVQISLGDQKSVAAQSVLDRISEVRAMVARASRLLHEAEEPNVDGVSTTVVTSTYPREIILPRDRHDNDKMDFTKVKILPTEDEIRSNHPEFLPSMELDQPHFLTDRTERHLDTLFRLLRHDVFGELKEALGQLMIALDNDPSVVDNPNLGLGNIRAYPNPKAHITYITFDQRRGLEAQIAFPQPHLLRKRSQTERCKWWQESKRLEEGTLLCFLFADDSRTSLLFFTVSEKRTDVKKEYSLSSHNYQATILTKLATRDQRDLELMTRLSCKDTHGILIELPAVVLATFIPILENLQSMQRSSWLPFGQWILPDTLSASIDTSKALSVPPPVYARQPGFNFSLQSILKDASGSLVVDSRMSANDTAFIDELEARTELDRGQCQALIAALTREYAFIQGPPGTGKSYLGVQLMKVLLQSKAKAKLGPIVVV